MRVTLRPAGWRDVWRLWRWRNEPTTRAMMIHDAPISRREHLAWFWRLSRNGHAHGAGTRQYIAEDDGEPVGSGRLDFTGIIADFDIIVAPGYRGQAYGTRLVAALVDEATRAECHLCRATVKRDNVASRKAFARNGFKIATITEGYFVMERLC